MLLRVDRLLAKLPLILYYNSTLHHKRHMFYLFDVSERITSHSNDIGEFPSLQ